MKICFVILQYLLYEDTIECIDSIKKLYSKYDYNIVIVDNASPNKAGEIIKNRYILDNSIDVLINDKNLGFSIGNNIGYKYCKDNYSPDFIVVNNNDVIFVDDKFFDVITMKFEKTRFDIIGPDVVKPDGKHTSPQYSELPNINKIKALRKKHLYRPIIEKVSNSYLYRKIMNEYHKNNEPVMLHNDTSIKYKEESSKAVIQGSCVIYSKKYIDSHEEAFYPMKSMGFEEILLRMQIEMGGGFNDIYP